MKNLTTNKILIITGAAFLAVCLVLDRFRDSEMLHILSVLAGLAGGTLIGSVWYYKAEQYRRLSRRIARNRLKKMRHRKDRHGAIAAYNNCTFLF